MDLTLKILEENLSVCKLATPEGLDINRMSFFSLSRTDEEVSLVCPSDEVPCDCIAREDGWKAFRIEGVLDFSLVGILANISGILAKEGISIFAISTFNTDYILVKKENFMRAIEVLGACLPPLGTP